MAHLAAVLAVLPRCMTAPLVVRQELCSVISEWAHCFALPNLRSSRRDQSAIPLQCVPRWAQDTAYQHSAETFASAL